MTHGDYLHKICKKKIVTTIFNHMNHIYPTIRFAKYMPWGTNFELPLVNVIKSDSSVMINNVGIIYVKAALIW